MPSRGVNGSVTHFQKLEVQVLGGRLHTPVPRSGPSRWADRHTPGPTLPVGLTRAGPQGFRAGIQYCAADGVMDSGPYPGDGGAGDVLKEPRSDLLQEVRLVAGWGEWGGQ